MTKARLVAVLAVLVWACGAAKGAEPRRMPAPKPPSIWSKLFGRSPSMPIARPLPRQQPAGTHAAGRNPISSSDGVEQASFEEPIPQTMPPRRPPSNKAPSPLTSWLQRPRRPSKTVSQFMAEERP